MKPLCDRHARHPALSLQEVKAGPGVDLYLSESNSGEIQPIVHIQRHFLKGRQAGSSFNNEIGEPEWEDRAWL